MTRKTCTKADKDRHIEFKLTYDEKTGEYSKVLNEESDKE